MSRRIYVDGIWDCFHRGHVKHLKTCKELDARSRNVLIVGVISDKEAESYKRKPVYDEEHRSILIGACRYVDEVIKDAPLVLTREFLETHAIDLVCHAFSNSNDSTNQNDFFRAPREMGIFRSIDYCKGISTTSIIHQLTERDPG